MQTCALGDLSNLEPDDKQLSQRKLMTRDVVISVASLCIAHGDCDYRACGARDLSHPLRPQS